MKRRSRGLREDTATVTENGEIRRRNVVICLFTVSGSVLRASFHFEILRNKSSSIWRQEETGGLSRSKLGSYLGPAAPGNPRYVLRKTSRIVLVALILRPCFPFLKSSRWYKWRKTFIEAAEADGKNNFRLEGVTSCHVSTKLNLFSRPSILKNSSSFFSFNEKKSLFSIWYKNGRKEEGSRSKEKVASLSSCFIYITFGQPHERFLFIGEKCAGGLVCGLRSVLLPGIRSNLNNRSLLTKSAGVCLRV